MLRTHTTSGAKGPRNVTARRGICRPGQRRGSSLLMALMYVTLFGALAASMTLFTSSTLEISAANDRATRAYAAAESGMSFLNLQFKQLAKPITAQGTIDPTLARTLFSGTGGIAPKLAAQLNGTTNLQGRTVIWNASIISIPPIKMFSSIDDSCFCLQIVQDATTPTILHVTSTGRCTGVMRSVTMDLTMDKRLKYAIYSNVAIQIGKNAVVEGDVVSTLTSFSKGPPVWTLTDFRALSHQTSLDTDLDNFRAYIKNKNPAFDNRLDVRTTAAAAAAAAQGFHDKNSDGFIDDWDLLLNRIDANGNKAISTGEYTDPMTGLPYDAELFNVIDALGPPLTTGDTPRAGYNDGILDARDAYAKVKGTVKVGVSQAAWDAWAKDTSSSGGAKYGVGFGEHFQGPVISSDPTVPPVEFAIDQTDVPVLTPSAFDTSGYAAQSGPSAGTTSGSVAAGYIKNATLTAAMANGGTATEGTPYGSTSIQATYKRPVFNNVTFENITIPKGLNAKFSNCTFKGCTYVNMETNITNGSGGTTTDPNDGMTWSKKMVTGSFSSTTTLTATNSYGFQKGNNLHFDNCTFNGPVAAANPTAYTHFTNSWEFTGATKFDNQIDPTATVLAPNTNIEMGSFSDPNSAPSTLVGVVVAGNIDIRGRSVVDGSIIVTGNGAGNTTLAYFGASDSTSDPTAMPEGGYGRLSMRYNPSRAMPNGISIPISLTPNATTYSAATATAWPW
jgi:hypothetical protein